MPQSLDVLIGTAIGGVGLKLIDYFVRRKDQTIDEASSIRKELRDSERSLRSDMVRLENELDTWRTRYFELLGRYTELEGKYRWLESQVAQRPVLLLPENHDKAVDKSIDKSIDKAIDIIDIRPSKNV